jgi:integrase
MRRQYRRLTVATVQANQKRGKPGLYGDGDGLCQQITPAGVSSWIYRYMADGREHKLGLGPTRDVSLADAREKALKFRQQRRDGIDPLAAKRDARRAKLIEAAKTVPTFEACAKSYISAHRAEWRSGKHAAQWAQSLEDFAFPLLGALPVDTIGTNHVMAVLQPIWAEKTETAKRLRARLENVLDSAKAAGYRDGLDNPARWRGHLKNLLAAPGKIKSVRHVPALDYREIGAFMTELRQRPGVAARALEFAVLTAARTAEVTRASWDEIDLTEKLWRIPGSRMKSGRDHSVPLSQAAMKILDAMAKVRDGSGFIFPGRSEGRPLGDNTLWLTLQEIRPGVSVHGFRAAFRSWISAETAYSHEVGEMALGHQVADAVVRAYQRSTLVAKRRQLAEAWARYCHTSPMPAGDVVAIGAARA